jgi:hypothetical protein
LPASSLPQKTVQHAEEKRRLPLGEKGRELKADHLGKLHTVYGSNPLLEQAMSGVNRQVNQIELDIDVERGDPDVPDQRRVTGLELSETA